MKYDILASKEIVDKTIEALKPRGVEGEFVEDKQDALDKLREYIPEGAEIMTGGSTTLDQIGFTDILKSGCHKWNNLKDIILKEQNPIIQNNLRKKSTLANYMIGSVNAVVETGEVLVVNASGSSIPSYSFSSDNVIWIVGTQKIVPTVEEGFKRLREYCFPLEDNRMKSIGYAGSALGKFLLFEKEINPNRKICMILVGEKLGF